MTSSRVMPTPAPALATLPAPLPVRRDGADTAEPAADRGGHETGGYGTG